MRKYIGQECYPRNMMIDGQWKIILSHSLIYENEKELYIACVYDPKENSVADHRLRTADLWDTKMLT